MITTGLTISICLEDIKFTSNSKNNDKLREKAKEKNSDIMECTVCHHLIENRTKHCKACNKCVENFDHHCVWLNACIGG